MIARHKLILPAFLLLSACGRPTPPPTVVSNTPPAPSAPISDFKVALVMSGPISDNGWNAGAYKALKAVRDELKLSDADSPYVDNATSSSDQEKNLRAFAG